MNRLQNELSPYLLCWAEDGVDWYPWGREPFSRAAEEHKPLLISIGTTPTQHTMHRGKGTAARLTERYFIPVQVDGEEHPEVAAYYAQAGAMLAGRTETPLSVLADSSGKPFFVSGALREVELAGLLSGVALHWNSDAADYEAVAALMGAQLCAPQQHGEPSEDVGQIWEMRWRQLQEEYDRENGGFGTGPKSLRTRDLLFLLAYGKYTGDRLPVDMAADALRAMALGAVRDQIGGGYFRGTTDARWLQPIPEKRLVDQAWLLEAYTMAYRATGDGLFRRVAAEIADFVMRELRHAAGGFYTAQWSEHGFYHWTASQVCEILGSNDGSVFCRQYSVGDEPSVPHLYNGDAPEEDSVLLHDLRMKLYRARLERGGIQRDDKVLAGRNGVMIAALARCGRALGVERYLSGAYEAERFVRSRLVSDCDLRRYWCHGTAAGDGGLEDFAGYALGLLELYRSGCGGEYLRHAAKVMTRGDALFSDHSHGGWYLTRCQSHLPARPKQQWDDAVPTAWGVGLMVLVGLAREIAYPGLRKRVRELVREAAGSGCCQCGYGLAAMMDMV